MTKSQRKSELRLGDALLIGSTAVKPHTRLPIAFGITASFLIGPRRLIHYFVSYWAPCLDLYTNSIARGGCFKSSYSYVAIDDLGAVHDHSNRSFKNLSTEHTKPGYVFRLQPNRNCAGFPTDPNCLIQVQFCL